jgi:hypothetical protein
MGIDRVFAVRALRLGDVGGDDLNVAREIGSTAASHRSYAVTPDRQMANHSKAEWTGAEDHVQLAPTHLLWLDPRAPLAASSHSWSLLLPPVWYMIPVSPASRTRAGTVHLERVSAAD